MPVQPHPTYSLVVPVYNEQAVLPLLLARLDALLDRLDGPTEVVFVDDGSRDLTSFILEQRARTDGRYRYAALSRNFGHQMAVSAGLDLARGQAVIIMDADLQDPPETVLALVEKWKEGNEVVSARRVARHGDTLFKRATAALFYRILKRLTPIDIQSDVGDFRLVDRKVVDAFRSLPERERFVRGMFAWLGFRQATVTFHRAERAAGQSNYPLPKMVRLAVNGIVGFSDVPLRLALWCGLAVSTLALCYGLFVVADRFAGAAVLPGWSSTIVVVAGLGGANMLMTGILGLYVGRIFAEVKGRPLYVLDRMIGFDGSAARGADRSPQVSGVEPDRDRYPARVA